jgi:DNA polymerase-3 subunit beta
LLRIDKAEFMAAVDRVSTISSERSRAVKLVLADHKLTLSVINPDSGSATEEIEVDYDQAPLEIGFNARYLLDIASELDSDTALLKLADSGSPTVIQDREGASALYVLMPMRV